MSRGRALTRYERLQRGWPVCASDDGCHRQPFRRGWCRYHYNRVPHSRGVASLGAVCIQPITFPAALWAGAKEAALRESITAAEVVRRALAEKLAR